MDKTNNGKLFHIILDENGDGVKHEIITNTKPIVYTSDPKYLYRAIKNNNIQMAEAVLKIINKNEIDEDEFAHAVEICLIKDMSPLEIIKLLIKHGIIIMDEIINHFIYYCQPDAIDYFAESKLLSEEILNTGLITAIGIEDINIVKKLISLGANVKHSNYLAVRTVITPKMKFDIIKTIFDAVDDFTWDDTRPMFLAIQWGRKDVVKELIKRKIVPEYQHLVIALEMGDDDICELVLNSIPELSQEELNLLASDALYNKHQKAIELLKKRGAKTQPNKPNLQILSEY